MNGKILGGSGSASGTPLIPQGPSRRGSPHSHMDSLSATARSVPATPLGISGSATHLLKTPGTPHTPDVQVLNGRIATPNSHLIGDNSLSASELQASLSRVPTSGYDNGSLTFNSISGSRDDVCSIIDITFGYLHFFRVV